MVQSGSGRSSDQSVATTAHGQLHCNWNVSPTLYQTDLRITNHRRQKFPSSHTLLSFITRIKWLSPRAPLFCSYHILTSSVIYYWTDARQHGIYLLNIEQTVNLVYQESERKVNPGRSSKTGIMHCSSLAGEIEATRYAIIWGEN